jgi:hypothetical protein
MPLEPLSRLPIRTKTIAIWASGSGLRHYRVREQCRHNSGSKCFRFVASLLRGYDEIESTIHDAQQRFSSTAPYTKELSLAGSVARRVFARGSGAKSASGGNSGQ